MPGVITIPAGEGHGVQGAILLSNYTEGYVNFEHGPDGTRLGTFIDGKPRPVNLTHDERKLLIELLATEEFEHEQKEQIAVLVPTEKIDARSEYAEMQRQLATQ